MPVYEYRCVGCGTREEHILLGREEPPTACATCGGALKRAWSGRVHVVFEGWGFKRTDSLVAESGSRKSWKELKERAERIVDE